MSTCFRGQIRGLLYVSRTLQIKSGFKGTRDLLFKQFDFSIHLLSSVQSLSCVRFFVTPWTAACQASLSTTNFRSLLKFMSIESVMPSNHLILCHPLLLPPSLFPSIRVFSSESVLRIRWPKYWSSSFIHHMKLRFCCFRRDNQRV